MDYQPRLMAYGIVEKLRNSISSEVRLRSIEELEKYRIHLEKTSKDKGVDSPLHFVEKAKELLQQVKS